MELVILQSTLKIVQKELIFRITIFTYVYTFNFCSNGSACHWHQKHWTKIHRISVYSEYLRLSDENIETSILNELAAENSFNWCNLSLGSLDNSKLMRCFWNVYYLQENITVYYVPIKIVSLYFPSCLSHTKYEIPAENNILIIG